MNFKFYSRRRLDIEIEKNEKAQGELFCFNLKFEMDPSLSIYIEKFRNYFHEQFHFNQRWIEYFLKLKGRSVVRWILLKNFHNFHFGKWKRKFSNRISFPLIPRWKESGRTVESSTFLLTRCFSNDPHNKVSLHSLELVPASDVFLINKWTMNSYWTNKVPLEGKYRKIC